MKSFFKNLKSFYGLAGSASVLVPGLAYFLNYSPPLIGGLSIIISALAAAFLWIGFKNEKKKNRRFRAIRCMIIGFVSSLFYWILLDLTSINILTSTTEVRYQVGFNLSYWSMEHDAIVRIENKTCAADSKKDLLLCYTVSEDNIYLIWKRWTVYLFGVINILIFAASSLIWCYGWGLILTTVGNSKTSTSLSVQSNTRTA